MDLATMRTRVEEILGAEDEVGATKLNEALNRVYRFEIPNRVGGATSKGHVNFSTAASTGDYDIDDLADADSNKVLKVLRQPIVHLSDGEELRYTTQPRVFWDWEDAGDTTEGKPHSALLDGRTLTLRPVPNIVYSMRFYAGLYRVALAAAGVADESEAWLCVAGAARDLGIQFGDDVSVARAEKVFERHIETVRAKYLGGSDTPLTQSTAQQGGADGAF